MPPPYHEDDEVNKNLSMISKREMMDVTKQAIKESVAEHVVTFGWWSLKTLGALAIGMVVYLSIYFERWHR